MNINLVNIIPKKYGNETNFDAEPSITVNPLNPNQIVITSFTPDMDPNLDGVKAPIFYSTDSGLTWEINSIVPGGVPGDISIRFGKNSGNIYSGIINGRDSSLNILRTTDFTGPHTMEVLLEVPPIGDSIIDQPWIETAIDNDKDVVFLSGNDLRQFPPSGSGQTAFIMISQDAANRPPPAGFDIYNYIETRQTNGQNLPSVRTSIHNSGIVYSVFFGYRTNDNIGNSINDIVVVRDDNWGKDHNSFKDLLDSTDGKAGQRIESNVTIARLGSLLGTQRVGSNLSIAVDPADPKHVYVFWGDGSNTPASPYNLHVRSSNDSGQTWTGDLFTVPNAINPCIAINANSVVGLLYQELVNRDGNDRWRTHFVHSKDHFNTATNDAILANVLDIPNSNPNILVSLGDYCDLVAERNDFYGVFSAYNEPDLANFPNGVTYLRNHDFNTKKLLDVSKTRSVPLSVDPFFVHCQIDQ